MTRVAAVVIGLFLLAVWIAGLVLRTQPLVTWLDAAGALLSFSIALLPLDLEGERMRTAIGLLTSLGLFAAWIIGLIRHAEAWVVWCMFAGACALAALSFATGARANRAAEARRARSVRPV